MRVTGLIPARFLTLTSHLVLLTTILMSREENVLACVPVQYTQAQYDQCHAEFLGGLIAGVALTLLEFIGFVSGVSMFSGFASLFSVMCHAGGSVGLSFLVLDVWDSRLYWWLFALTSVVPAILELCVIVNVLMLKKNV